MKKLLLSLLLIASPLLAQQATQATAGVPAQFLNGTGAPSASYTCNASFSNIPYYQSDAAAGQRIWICDGTTWNQNSPALGTPINQTGIAGSLSSQTICAASAVCPIGLYHIDIYVEVQTVATGSFSAMTLAYTDDIGATTAPLTNCTTLSLAAATRCSVGWTFRHAANTTVTLATTVGTLIGTPSYSVYSQLTRLQ